MTNLHFATLMGHSTPIWYISGLALLDSLGFRVLIMFIQKNWAVVKVPDVMVHLLGRMTMVGFMVTSAGQ
jgi:hypothetical protein